MKSSLGSWIWKKLLKYRNIAKGFTKSEIQNGEITSFWFDIRTPSGRLYDITGSRGCIDLGVRLEATVESVVRSHRQRRHRVDTHNTIENHILSLKEKGLSNRTDVKLWRRGDDKYKPKFSSKETWKLTREVHMQVNWSHGIWFQFNTPKYAFMSWLATLNRLATGDRILQWNTSNTSSCLLCPDPLETRDHLFFTCQFSEAVWKGLTQKLLSTRYTNQWNHLQELLLDMNRDRIDMFVVRYVFQTTLYSIWWERNQRKHGEPPKTTSQDGQKRP